MSPKFKPGDIVTDDVTRPSYLTFTITGVTSGNYYNYTYVDEKGVLHHESLSCDKFERNGTRKLTKLDKALQ